MTTLSSITTAAVMQFRFVHAVRRNVEERCLDFTVSTKIIYSMPFAVRIQVFRQYHLDSIRSILFQRTVHSGKG